MRVLLTNTGPWGTGSAVVAEAVLQELRRRGHRAALFFPDAQFETPEKKHYYSKPNLYRVWRYPVERDGRVLETFPLMITDPHPRNFPGACTFRSLSDELLAFYFEEARRELARVVDWFRPDIVECHHIWSMGHLVGELGLPYVAVAHHSDQLGYRYDLRIHPYANRAAAGAQWIFAISEFVRREVLTLYARVPEEKVVILENGYNQRIFHPQRVNRARALRQLGVENASELPIITFSGKISHTKGVDILLRANRLVQRERKALLLLLGAGRLEQQFSAEERAEFHLENVRQVGHRPQPVLAKLHNLATVSVMPSRSEGFGIAALEAMGCGTPVVATRSGGPETFVVGETVPVGDVEALAAALLQVLNLSPRATRELRQAALRKARHYSWREIVTRRLRYFRQALK
ncbi:MAG: glycosyltransferase family 4 protein [Terriglobia bacterium]